MSKNSLIRLLEETDVLRSGSHVIIAHHKHWTPDTTADLSAEEKQRFITFENEAAAQSFNHRRSLLRQILSIATGRAKKDISYQIDNLGKPELSSQPQNPIYFNISQGSGLCAIAICRNAAVGIDIEPEISADAMGDVCGFLHRDERAFIESQDDQKSAFLDVWVQKEAVSKCFGFGFTRPAGSWSCLDALDKHRAHRFEVDGHRMCLCATREKPVSFWRSDRRLA